MKEAKINGYELKLKGKLSLAELVLVLRKEWGVEVVGKPSNYLHADGEWHPFEPVEGYFVYKNEMIDGQPEWYLIPNALAKSDAIFHDGYDTRYAQGVLCVDEVNGGHTPVHLPIPPAIIGKLNTACPEGCEPKIVQCHGCSSSDPVRDRFFAVPVSAGGFLSSPIMLDKSGAPIIPPGSWELVDGDWVHCSKIVP